MWVEIKFWMLKTWARAAFSFVYWCPVLKHNVGARLWATTLLVDAAVVACELGKLEVDRGI